MKRIILFLMLSLTLFLVACQPMEVTCNSPYIKVGTSCCLDENDNSICDNDEEIVQQKNEIASVSSDYKVEKESNSKAEDIIKEKCQKRYPDDFSMRAFCEEQQWEGYNDLLNSKPTGMNNDEFEILKDKCLDRYPDDFSMRAFCEGQQVEGFNDLMLEKPIGMSGDDFQTIKNKCLERYPKDFSMRAFCEEQQVKGWKELN